jgi:hypothetical protein
LQNPKSIALNLNQEKYLIENQLQIRIKDPSFDVDLLEQFELCIQLIDNAFTFCVIDTQSKRCLLLESYHLLISPDRSFKEQLQLIFEDHHFLMAGFWKAVKISTFNRQFALVPYPLFDESAIDKYIEQVASFDPNHESLYHYKHILPDSVNVFAANSEITNWIKSFYPSENVKVIHQTSALIQAMMRENESISLKTIYLIINKGYFTILIKNETSLEYCNIFSFASEDELLFNLMFVSSTLNINRKASKLILYGEIIQNSDLYNKITSYFSFVSIGSKPAYLKYGYVFDEIPDQHFFDLFSIFLC